MGLREGQPLSLPSFKGQDAIWKKDPPQGAFWLHDSPPDVIPNRWWER
jgi:hypothetical protein